MSTPGRAAASIAAVRVSTTFCVLRESPVFCKNAGFLVTEVARWRVTDHEGECAVCCECLLLITVEVGSWVAALSFRCLWKVVQRLRHHVKCAPLALARVCRARFGPPTAAFRHNCPTVPWVSLPGLTEVTSCPGWHDVKAPTLVRSAGAVVTHGRAVGWSVYCVSPTSSSSIERITRGTSVG